MVAALTPGRIGNAQTTVDHAQTAKYMGSGTEAVFATPAMVALMEAAAVACTEEGLAEGEISLGTKLQIEHMAASALGAKITAHAELLSIEARTLQFAVAAFEGDRQIGRGTHTRVIVDRARFLAKLLPA